MRVMLIDDHALFRFGLQELLERRDILDQEPRFREEGLSALATAVYHLTNGHL